MSLSSGGTVDLLNEATDLLLRAACTGSAELVQVIVILIVIVGATSGGAVQGSCARCSAES
jgi:hypothetical protein